MADVEHKESNCLSHLGMKWKLYRIKCYVFCEVGWSTVSCPPPTFLVRIHLAHSSVYYILLPYLVWYSYCASQDSWQNPEKGRGTIDPDQVSRLQSLSHRGDVASLCVFYKYFMASARMSFFSPLVPWLQEFKRVTRFATRFYRFTVELVRCKRHFLLLQFSSLALSW